MARLLGPTVSRGMPSPPLGVSSRPTKADAITGTKESVQQSGPGQRMIQ